MTQPSEKIDALPGERQSISFFAAAGWTVAAQLAFALALQGTEAARPGAMGDLVSATACCVLAYSLVVFVMVRVYEPESSLRRVLALRKVSPFSVVFAALVGAGIAPTMHVMGSLIERRFPTSTEELERQSEILGKLLATPTLGSKIALFVAVVILIPAAEDLFFRGMLFGGLRKGRTLALATLTTAAYFALSHEEPRDIPALFVVGLVLAWLRGQTGSIIPSFIANAAYCAMPALPQLLNRAGPEELFPRAVPVGAAALALLAAGGIQLVSQRDARAIEARRADS